MAASGAGPNVVRVLEGELELDGSQAYLNGAYLADELADALGVRNATVGKVIVTITMVAANIAAIAA